MGSGFNECKSHGVQGPWSGDLIEGAAGTLVSPNRGLLVFSPWIALSLLALPATARRGAVHPRVPGVSPALVRREPPGVPARVIGACRGMTAMSSLETGRAHARGFNDPGTRPIN